MLPKALGKFKMRYENKFEELKRNNEGALIPFVVIGDPDYETSLEIVKSLVKSGADILELGLAFSDPIADGPTIQLADKRVLDKKINTDRVFDFIKEVRKFTDIPIGLLVYYNLVYQRGIEKFYIDANNAGVDSILIADMPIEEAEQVVRISEENQIGQIFIVSPLTSKERLVEIAKKGRGFIYVVSRLGVTGARDDMQQGTIELLKRIRPHTNLKLCVGFGISKPEHVKAVLNAGADGAITGSAIVKIIENNLGNKEKMLQEICNFIKEMKEATKLECKL